MTEQTTIDTIARDQITALRDEAGQAGDLDMVATCDDALQGDQGARLACAKVIARAEAMREDA
jgi:hypothetical protein